MKKYITRIIAMMLVASLFTSCLKDDAVNDYTNIEAIIIIPNGNWPKATAITATKVGAAEILTSAVYARISWDRPLTKDVVVTFVEDPSAITAYNNVFKTTYVALNTDAYKLISYKVTIKAGENNANVPLEIYGSKIDFAKSNMLSFSISDAAGEKVSSNYKTYLVPITKK
jgi:hypothetical protein